MQRQMAGDALVDPCLLAGEPTNGWSTFGLQRESGLKLYF